MFNTQTAIEKLNELGYSPKTLNLGRIVRFAAPGKPQSNRSGWAKLCEDGTVIAGDWTTGERLVIKPDLSGLSEQERAQRAENFERLQAKQRAREAREFEQARLKAIHIWQSADEVFEHDYLHRKTIDAHGVRFKPHLQGMDNVLIIPVYAADQDNRLQSLQLIDPNGNKRFLKGGRKKAGFYVLADDLLQGRVIICEGFATGATLQEYRFESDTVICAFDAGNLEPVAVAFRKKWPKREMIIAADNDHQATFNTGLMKARQAALVANAELIYPHFHKGESGSDFNDHWQNEQAWLKRQLERIEAQQLYNERGVIDD